MTTYERIRQLCIQRGFAISNLSQKIPELNITKASISGWKRGSTPNAMTLKAISEYFGVSVGYLLDGSQSDLTYNNSTIKKEPQKETQLPDDIRFALFDGINDLSDDDIRDVLKYIEYKKRQKG